jgi:DGQHR domain-containing protein
MDKFTIDLPSILIKQPIGDFYCSKIKASVLKDIAASDIREMKSSVDEYLGIQREINSDRVKRIGAYISNLDATFPNAIILSVDENNYKWDKKSNTLTLECELKHKNSLVKILDGQHRLAGFDDKNFTYLDENGKKKDFELLIVVFAGADIATQANIFATVNLAQTKVNKSLVYDLESYAISRSPEKTCHDISIILNSDASSNNETQGPFYRRIKRLGVKSSQTTNELITQAAFVENLLTLISPKPKEDRNILRGKTIKFFGFDKKELSYMSDKELSKYIFRKAFSQDKDDVILSNIDNYFSAIEKVWPGAWDSKNKISILNKTVALEALIRFYRDIYKKLNPHYVSHYDKILTESSISDLLYNLDIEEDFFFNLEPTSKTAGFLYKSFCIALNK